MPVLFPHTYFSREIYYKSLFGLAHFFHHVFDNLGKQCLWLTTKPKIKIHVEVEFSFLLVRKLPKTSETNRIGLAAHLKMLRIKEQVMDFLWSFRLFVLFSLSDYLRRAFYQQSEFLK